MQLGWFGGTLVVNRLSLPWGSPSCHEVPGTQALQTLAHGITTGSSWAGEYEMKHKGRAFLCVTPSLRFG